MNLGRVRQEPSGRHAICRCRASKMPSMSRLMQELLGEGFEAHQIWTQRSSKRAEPCIP
jgi:hypothetical protein